MYKTELKAEHNKNFLSAFLTKFKASDVELLGWPRVVRVREGLWLVFPSEVSELLGFALLGKLAFGCPRARGKKAT